jgi:hypothetical protein
LPLFQQILNSFVARAMNSELGLSGTYWEREPYSAPATEGDDDVVDRCVYVLTNPCRANLVERAEEWTGVSSYALEYGQPIFATRPGFFHDSMPEQVEIRLVRPRVMLELSDEDLRRHIRQRVRAVEAELAAERRKSGTRVLGMRRVRAQSIHDNPQRRETATKAQPRKPPRCRWSLVALAQRSYDWVAAYRKALKDWVADKTNVVFPAGTYLMRVRYGVACASP